MGEGTGASDILDDIPIKWELYELTNQNLMYVLIGIYFGHFLCKSAYS
jgi:hypothetical protein